ncbi:Aste57867_5635 [Aphanomyces stellatus]|uniref:Aste57867_5635 protein n=1 Tax=Aphanomyces stellatus TaxID=120398 RepID=A0A485KH45_9STRA|nr:hypothetical protein As57867_005622 [Aphanomyces stellatus]VFT82681.1 Aste57867_5635 [Aphanomyces stellatus]
METPKPWTPDFLSSSSTLPGLSSPSKTRELSVQDSPVLKNVRGFYHVKNENDLLLCMEGLNELFNRAVDMEAAPGETQTPRSTSKPQPENKKPNRARAALTPRSAKQQEYVEQAAYILHDDPSQLARLLRTPDMVAAMNATGITKEELGPREREEFTKEKHRAWSVPTEVAAMRFKHYEKSRKNGLALLLQIADDMRDGGVGGRPASSMGLGEQQGYAQELAHEHKLLEEMIKGRLKYEKILEREAVKIKKKRAEYLVVDKGVPLRKNDESAYLKLRDQMNAEKCELNRLKMERVQKQREILEETRKQNTENRRRFEKSKNDNSKREKELMSREKRAQEEERQKKRQQVRDEAKMTDIQRRQQIQTTLEEKEEALREKRRMEQRRNLLQKEKKRLEIQDREANVLHIKNVQKFRKEQAARKIQSNYRRIDNMNEVKRAIVEERNRIHKLARIRYSNCKDLSEQIRLSPGPGEYNPPLDMSTSGGIWSPLPKGPTDVQRLHATPGPGAYEEINTVETNMRFTGTTFAKSRLLNTLEMQLGPGPGQYISSIKCSSFAAGKGPLFPNSNVASPFEISLRRAAELPAPCDYSPSSFPKDLAPSTVDFKRTLHTMTTSYLLASKGKGDIMIDADINALEHGSK